MYQEYDIPEEKKELFGVLLEILHEIDRVCRKNKIRYFAFWGTLIGAVRHHGYIPWDDDIDLAMLREDYNRFIEICPKELSSGYSLQTTLNEKGYYRYPLRIRKDNTTFFTPQEIKKIKAWKEIPYNCGVFVTIAPLDVVPKSRVIVKYQEKMAGLRNQLLISNAYTLDKRLAPTLVKLYCKLVGYKNVFIRMNKSYSRYNKTNGNMVQYPPLYTEIETTLYKEDFDGTEYIAFEDMEIPCPKGYDRVLKRGYGDYMIPPPENTRDHHHAEYIDLHKGYKDVLKMDRQKLIVLIEKAQE